MNISSFKEIYDFEALKRDKDANHGRTYQQCSMSVMDTISDPNITFDENGVCNYFKKYKEDEVKYVFKGDDGVKKLEEDFNKIKQLGKGKKYDCILGLSGGVDSTYLCLLAKQHGLNPLVVHCDNGWNSELAQHNIENTVKICGFDLYTYVINWQHFKELQLSYLKASVVDIEVLTDHAFMAVLYEQSRKWKIKHVLAGMNIVTEQVLPSFWIYTKGDSVNIQTIQKQFGTKAIKELKTFPFLDWKTRKYCQKVLKLEVISPLNYIEYKYDEVKSIIKEELKWRDYGGKHYESIWTRFYQGYILPRKFNIDKRKAHLSNLIFSGQLTKVQAEEILANSSYPTIQLMQEDYEYVIKKLGLSEQEFEKIMNTPRKEHTDYPTMKGFWETYPVLTIFKPLLNIFRK